MTDTKIDITPQEREGIEASKAAAERAMAAVDWFIQTSASACKKERKSRAEFLGMWTRRLGQIWDLVPEPSAEEREKYERNSFKVDIYEARNAGAKH